MSKKQYVCLGDCQALIPEEQYNMGLKVCGNQTCNLKGKSFVRGSKCSECGRNSSEEKPHKH